MSYSIKINKYHNKTIPGYDTIQKQSCKICGKSIYVNSDIWGTIRNKKHKIKCCSQLCVYINHY